MSDLGSGCFVDLSPYGFQPEPLVADRVRAGVDLVCFSGDKLLGGPQEGVVKTPLTGQQVHNPQVDLAHQARPRDHGQMAQPPQLPESAAGVALLLQHRQGQPTRPADVGIGRAAGRGRG